MYGNNLTHTYKYTHVVVESIYSSLSSELKIQLEFLAYLYYQYSIY